MIHDRICPSSISETPIERTASSMEALPLVLGASASDSVWSLASLGACRMCRCRLIFGSRGAIRATNQHNEVTIRETNV
jgi:hypothetical protein